MHIKHNFRLQNIWRNFKIELNIITVGPVFWYKVSNLLYLSIFKSLPLPISMRDQCPIGCHVDQWNKFSSELSYQSVCTWLQLIQTNFYLQSLRKRAGESQCIYTVQIVIIQSQSIQHYLIHTITEATTLDNLSWWPTVFSRNIGLHGKCSAQHKWVLYPYKKKYFKQYLHENKISF